MKLITLNLPATYLQGIEKLVREEIYPNRSEAIRHAVRDLIKKENAFHPIISKNKISRLNKKNIP